MSRSARMFDLMPFGTPSNLYPYPIDFDPTDRAHLALLADGTIAFRVLTPSHFTRAALAIRTTGAPDIVDFDLIGRAGQVALWELRLDRPEAPIDYSLAFMTDDDRPVYVTANGITGAIERLDPFRLDPSGMATHDVPGWATGALIYQIFPDRFANGDPAVDPDDVRPWDDPPTRQGFQGGDLTGIAHRAEYLASLGVDAVYLNPINASLSNHRYDATDFMSVDERLGGDDALRTLVKELHAHDIKLILDVSLNHAHPSWAPFADRIATGRASSYADWFVVEDEPPRIKVRRHEIEAGSWWAEMIDTLSETTGLELEFVEDDGAPFEATYDTWYGVVTMPRIELSNPGARAFALSVIRHWIDEFDIDGWRLDVARYIDPDVWPDVREAARAAKADTYLIGEIYGDTSAWLQGDMFDTTMNYTFRQLVLDWIGRRRFDADTFLEGYLRMLAMYSPEVTAASHNLIGSHDKPRFLTLADGDVDRLRLAGFLQLTLPGSPGVYYGDELATPGGEDPDNRATFKWDRVDGHPLVDQLRTLGTLRQSHAELRSGGFRLRASTAEGFLFDRGNDALQVGINGGTDTISFEVDAATQLAAVSGEARLVGGELHLGPMSGAVVI